MCGVWSVLKMRKSMWRVWSVHVCLCGWVCHGVRRVEGSVWSVECVECSVKYVGHVECGGCGVRGGCVVCGLWSSWSMECVECGA